MKRKFIFGVWLQWRSDQVNFTADKVKEAHFLRLSAIIKNNFSSKVRGLCKVYKW